MSEIFIKWKSLNDVEKRFYEFLIGSKNLPMHCTTDFQNWFNELMK